jgi:RNA polymerase sigma factor (sigma-70 family)
MESRNPYDYYPKIVNYLRKKFGDKELCEEAAHIACYRALLKANTFNGTKSAYGAWLSKIAYNAACDLFRKKMVEKKYLEQTNFTSVTGEEESSKLAETKISRAFLEKLINQLEPFERQILCLKYFYDYKNYEIAETLHLDVNYVSYIIFKSKRKLRALIKK